MYIYVSLFPFISFYFYLFLLFLFIVVYFFLFLFISFYFFLFLFSGEQKKNMIFKCVFLFSDHPNHVVTNLLQPAPPLSLADKSSHVHVDEASSVVSNDFLAKHGLLFQIL